MVIRSFVVSLVGFLLIAGCGSGARQIGEISDYTYPINPQHILANLTFLASDAMEGREAVTRAEKLAALYIATELQKYGILPFGDDSTTYLQQVSLKRVTFDKNSLIALVGDDSAPMTVFRCDSDFVGSNRYYSGVDTTTGLVFAGYGITAEEYDYDDYRELDVKGKIVLFLHGEPASDDTAYFAGEDRTKYSSWRRKIEYARELGAAGVMMPSWSEKAYGWQSVVDNIKKGTLSLLESAEDNKVVRNRLPTVALRGRTLEKLFSYAPYSYSDLDSLIENKAALPNFEFNTAVKVNWKFSPGDTVQAFNVLGILPGNDPDLRHECIVIGAHYDHVGINRNEIYNGADDNASGTVGVMEIARACGYNHGNARSIVFAFHTAEEKGLLGSKYLVQNYRDKKNIMAHVNMDMIGRGAEDSIYSVGSDRISSELREIVEQVNENTVQMKFNYQFDNPDDPERIYYRSDHYSYAREGIPSVFFYDNMQEDYHKPTDTVDKINITKVTKITELGYHIVLDLSNLPHALEHDRLAKGE